jgi:hypothetical protein
VGACRELLTYWPLFVLSLFVLSLFVLISIWPQGVHVTMNSSSSNFDYTPVYVVSLSSVSISCITSAAVQTSCD